MTTQQQLRSPNRGSSGALSSWATACALIALGALPLVAGVLRLIQLAGGPSVLPIDNRMSGFPLPVMLHIIGAAIFIPLGAVQFVPGVRWSHPAWHRRAGRVTFVAGLVAAGSALMMTLLYSQKAGTGDLLYIARIFFSSAMGISLILALVAIRRRDVSTHRAWMIRAYAIGVAAGTQIFTESIANALFGIGVIQNDLAKISGWLINLAIAEWIIRRNQRMH